MKVRPFALGSLGACAVAFSILYACSSSSTPATPASCASLDVCCIALPPAEQPSCTATASEGSDSTCSSVLATYTTAGACSSVGHVGFDASFPLFDTGAPRFDTGVPHFDTGFVTVDSGTHFDAGPFSGPSCPKATSTGSADCQDCENNCESQFSFVTACQSYYDCFCPCAAGDTGCQQACAPLEGDCMEVVSEVSSCVTSDCESLCNPPTDGGTSSVGDAGACGNLLNCCDRLIDGGILGAIDAAVCPALVAQAKADGGTAGCEAELTSGPFASACQNPP